LLQKVKIGRILADIRHEREGIMRINAFKLLIILLSINIVAAGAAGVVIEKKGGLPWLRDQADRIMHYRPKVGAYAANRESVFQQYPIRNNDIVFLGDSMFDLAEWSEWLGNRAKNRGISGDYTTTMLSRIVPIINGHPRHIVLSCGGNNMQRNIPLSKTKAEYKEIIRRLSEGSRETDIWVLQTLPINEKLYRKWIMPEFPGINMPRAKAVNELNQYLSGLENGRVHFIRLPGLLNGNEISEKYTIDGLHLNGAGLKVIADKLRPMLK
jgi:lysophospholipase L1-like esterase